jgi:hypothetical protein
MSITSIFMKRLKYQQEIDKFQFNFDSFEEQERMSFIYVFKDILESRNFLPKYVRQVNCEHDNCLGWSLSFFDSQEHAKNRIRKLASDKNFIYKKLGTHLGTGRLEKNDGISNEPCKSGHFSHFEYEDVVLNKKFEVIESLVNE